MNKQTDLYELLEVSPAASREVIKAAYRCLSQLNHPDRHAGSSAASARQAQFNLAYATLADPESRLKYDRVQGIQRIRTERRGDTFTSAKNHIQTPGSSRPISASVMRIFALRPFD